MAAVFAAVPATALAVWFFRPSYKHHLEEDEDEMKSMTSKEIEEEYAGNETLIPLLVHKQISIAELSRRGYSPVLEIVRALLGIIPRAHNFLEIWPPAFKAYNLMVPNFFQVPIHTLGLQRYQEAALAMHVASRVAECPYCSAHTCSFALRRGLDPTVLAQALLPGKTSLSAEDLSIIEISRGLVRNELTTRELDGFRKLFPKPSEAEWIACGAIGMGFLNKFMDSLGVPLEPAMAAETAEVMEASGLEIGKAGHEIRKAGLQSKRVSIPTKDSLQKKLMHLRHLPGCISLENSWTAPHNIPSDAKAVGDYLENLTGCRFPILEKIVNRRVRFAITAMIRENLDETTTETGLKIKPAMGMIFAKIVKCPLLEVYMELLASKFGTTRAALDSASVVAVREGAHPEKNTPIDSLLRLAKAISPSPVQVDSRIQQCLADKSPEQILETVSWIALLQLLQRLIAFYPDP